MRRAILSCTRHILPPRNLTPGINSLNLTHLVRNKSELAAPHGKIPRPEKVNLSTAWKFKGVSPSFLFFSYWIALQYY